jgi:translation initiation factor 3 subunit K
MYVFSSREIRKCFLKSDILTILKQTEEPIKTYVNLAHLLETAQFGAYWKESAEIKSELDKAAGFHDAIRTCNSFSTSHSKHIPDITNVVLSTYRTISKDFLSEVLALKSSAELDALVNSRGWTATNDTVSFPKSEENVTKPKKITESVKFQDLTKIMAHLS